MVRFHSDFLPIAPPLELGGVEMAVGIFGFWQREVELGMHLFWV